jgi:hypothetical protein
MFAGQQGRLGQRKVMLYRGRDYYRIQIQAIEKVIAIGTGFHFRVKRMEVP